jgi:hypothetical protein
MLSEIGGEICGALCQHARIASDRNKFEALAEVTLRFFGITCEHSGGFSGGTDACARICECRLDLWMLWIPQVAKISRKIAWPYEDAVNAIYGCNGFNLS